MRLIDADALPITGVDITDLPKDGTALIVYSKENVDNAPTVDAERHGHWEYSPKDAFEVMFELPKCSVCGHESSDALNYCSNCGAKMDEVEKKEIKKICILSNGTLKEEYDIPNVIRCKDCKYWRKNGDCYGGFDFEMDANDFCSRGERKDEED